MAIALGLISKIPSGICGEEPQSQCAILFLSFAAELIRLKIASKILYDLFSRAASAAALMAACCADVLVNAEYIASPELASAPSILIRVIRKKDSSVDQAAITRIDRIANWGLS